MKDKEIFLTKEGYEALLKELEDLKRNKRREVTEKIKEAKEFGDLSENAEYTEAKNQQAFVEGRILTIESILSKAKIIEEDGYNDKVTIGSKVKLLSLLDNSIVEYHIVSSPEVNIKENKISDESPVGKALIGAGIGEVIRIKVPKGEVVFKILEIRR
ncbi:transcription elongation factor GreA [bacterium]|nr:transcription elongation factor GreA [bacterium]